MLCWEKTYYIYIPQALITVICSQTGNPHWSQNSWDRDVSYIRSCFNSFQIDSVTDKDMDFEVSSVSFPLRSSVCRKNEEHHVWVPHTTRPAEIILQTRKRRSADSHFSYIFLYTASGIEWTLILWPVACSYSSQFPSFTFCHFDTRTKKKKISSIDYWQVRKWGNFSRIKFTDTLSLYQQTYIK